MCLKSLIFANKLKLHECNCTRSASDVRTQINQIHANHNNLHVKFYKQIFLICMYFSCIFACMFLHECFTSVFLLEFACNMVDFHARNTCVMLQCPWPVL